MMDRLLSGTLRYEKIIVFINFDQTRWLLSGTFKMNKNICFYDFILRWFLIVKH
jgi:hypothetical protein